MAKHKVENKDQILSDAEVKNAVPHASRYSYVISPNGDSSGFLCRSLEIGQIGFGDSIQRSYDDALQKSAIAVAAMRSQGRRPPAPHVDNTTLSKQVNVKITESEYHALKEAARRLQAEGIGPLMRAWVRERLER